MNNEETQKCRTCLKCGRVYFGVSRKYAEFEVKKFNEYFDTLSKKDQEDYYGGSGSSMKQYENCYQCGNSYENFRDSKPDDCPTGCTISPIIVENGVQRANEVIKKEKK